MKPGVSRYDISVSNLAALVRSAGIQIFKLAVSALRSFLILTAYSCSFKRSLKCSRKLSAKKPVITAKNIIRYSSRYSFQGLGLCCNCGWWCTSMLKISDQRLEISFFVQLLVLQLLMRSPDFQTPSLFIFQNGIRYRSI